MAWLATLFSTARGAFRSRASLQIENLALRHQLNVLRRTRRRPRIRPADRAFWSWLSRVWPGWRDALVIVQPETVDLPSPMRQASPTLNHSFPISPPKHALYRAPCRLLYRSRTGIGITGGVGRVDHPKTAEGRAILLGSQLAVLTDAAYLEPNVAGHGLGAN